MGGRQQGIGKTHLYSPQSGLQLKRCVLDNGIRSKFGADWADMAAGKLQQAA